MAGKLAAGEGFTLEDFLEQMLAIRKMGPIANLLGMLPGMGQMKEAIKQVDDRDLDRTAAIIRSMTPAGAGQPQDHQRLAPGAHRQRLRRQRHRRQPAARPVRRGPEDDEPDGRQHGPARHGPDVEEGPRPADAGPVRRRARRARAAKAAPGPPADGRARAAAGDAAGPARWLPGGHARAAARARGCPTSRKLNFDQFKDERPGR